MGIMIVSEEGDLPDLTLRPSPGPFLKETCAKRFGEPIRRPKGHRYYVEGPRQARPWGRTPIIP